MEPDSDLAKVVGLVDDFDGPHVGDPWWLQGLDELPMDRLPVGVVDHFLAKNNNNKFRAK